MGERVAFIGLGVMGYPMAAHLSRAGHDVVVHNRSREKAERWVGEHAGSLAETPAAAADGASFVFACVGNDDDVRSITTGPRGAFAAMAPGSVFVDHTTTSAVLARELAEAGGVRGIGVLDAPVSGGQAGAEAGALTVMVGGEPDCFTKAQPLIDAYSRCARRLGSNGAGQLTKMVNQICVAGVIQGLAEGIAFAQAVSLDVEAVVDVISKGAAQSWQMDNRALTMHEGRYDFGFAVDWMRKDLGMTLDTARSHGVSLSVTALIDDYYAEVQRMGGGRWDTSSLLARLGRGAS